ncbi:hypothetical protein J437_LFUL000460 [Ladona fulva]|uniref:Rab-GAP TBC domain-containing protein n=1 Tax=Ladona fulva TaxID=123851 RepID=A0A8K0KPR3_LADFU|nr:hypothetical protein J437_LFUL000460 [Ladona fulva]
MLLEVMDREIRRRHHSLKQSSDVVDDKKTPIRKISTQSSPKTELNGSDELINNIPFSETVESNGTCEFDSLVGSTCSSEDCHEYSAEISDDFEIKISKIQDALRSPVDRETLRTFARSEGGLLNDEMRRKVWPELLEIVGKKSTFTATDEDIKNHKEFNQVVLDVNRALKRFPPGVNRLAHLTSNPSQHQKFFISGISNSERVILQDQLTKLILTVIVKHPFLCYYQGYHDVAVTLLLVVGNEKGPPSEHGENGSVKQILKSDPTSLAVKVGNGAGDPSENEVTSVEETSPKSDTWCKEESEPQVEEETIKGKITCFDAKGDEIPLENDSPANDVGTEGKKEREECMEVEVNSVSTDSFFSSGNEDEKKLESDTDERKIDTGNVSGGFSDSETEFADKPARKHVISMWCSEVALNMLEHLSLHHFRGCMEPTMDATSRLLHHVFPIVARVDHLLCAFLDRSGVGTVYCLPWILTWYGHSLSNHDVVVRLYDYFLASPVEAPLYLAASIILYRRKEILETECDMAAVHGLLSQIPDDLPFELLLTRASALYKAHPPESLQKDVEERCNRELYAREERSSKFGNRRMSQPDFNSAVIQWPLLAILPPQYVNRFVPWLWMPRGRMQWLGAWAQMIPLRHINRRFLLAALPLAMYGIYSHLASNTGN